MPNQPPKTGVFAHLYYNSGTYNSPTWVEVTSAMDVDLPDEMAKAEAGIRGDGGLDATLVGMRKIGLTFGLLWNTGATDFQALHPAYLAQNNTEFLALDGVSNVNSGSQGPRFTGVITKFHPKQSRNEAIVADVEVERTISGNPTSWFTA
jgi:hypothetical protein